MGIDRPAKYNGFTPAILDQLAAAYTTLEGDDERWCGVLFPHGPHFTAGLDLATVAPRMAAGEPLFPAHLVDPMDLREPLRAKAVVAAVHGICFTAGIELMLAADVVVAASALRAARGAARDPAGRRRYHPHGGARRMGQRHSLPAHRR
jgi:enoyl-CoA hydratase/carnithine racemase